MSADASGRRRPGAPARVRALALALAACAGAALAATPAGTIIRNQASASFLGAGGERVTVTSNLVETRVERVAGLELASDRARRAAPDELVDLPHAITNTGNGDDAFALAAMNLGADNIDLEDVEIYPDADGDGVADAGPPIAVTPTIVAGASFDVVVRARVPDAATDGSIARAELVATSVLDPSLAAANTDAVTVGAGGAVTVTKRSSARAGAAGSGPHRVTLAYENVGDGVAGDLALVDALPPGMVYVPGSGRWSGTGAAPLSDADPDDVHAGAIASVRWCAYDASCTGVPEATADGDADSTNQVTAIVDYVPPGATGTISFDVTIGAAPPGPLANVAEFEHDVAIATVDRARTNAVTFTVLPTPGVVANGSSASSAPGADEPVRRTSATAGATVRFDNVVWNAGDATDTFDVEVDGANSTFPPGTLWRLLRGDAATPLLDTDGNGRVDTGPVAPGASAVVVLELRLPADAAGDGGGAGFEIVKRARSATDTSVSDPVIDRLDRIVAAAVDLTNLRPAGDADAAGEGVGPEAEPVTTLSPDDAGEARFELHVAHLTGPPASYSLAAHAAMTGAAPDDGSVDGPVPLPDGWSVRFEDPATGDPLTATPTLGAGESVALVAVVVPAPDAPAGTVSVFFEATSADGVATDVKHDAVAIGPRATLAFAPDGRGRAEPGGSFVHAHRLTSSANVPIEDLVFELSGTEPGWSVELWDDASGDGELGAGDALIAGPSTIAPGEARTVFAKVTAPAGAPIGAVDVTGVEVRWSAGAESLAVSDRTEVSLANVSIRKLQAGDVGCDGAPDPGTGLRRRADRDRAREQLRDLPAGGDQRRRRDVLRRGDPGRDAAVDGVPGGRGLLSRSVHDRGAGRRRHRDAVGGGGRAGAGGELLAGVLGAGALIGHRARRRRRPGEPPRDLDEVPHQHRAVVAPVADAETRPRIVARVGAKAHRRVRAARDRCRHQRDADPDRDETDRRLVVHRQHRRRRLEPLVATDVEPLVATDVEHVIGEARARESRVEHERLVREIGEHRTLRPNGRVVGQGEGERLVEQGLGHDRVVVEARAGDRDVGVGAHERAVLLGVVHRRQRELHVRVVAPERLD